MNYEETADKIKMLTVHALMRDGLLKCDGTAADQWCLKNSFILRKRNVFQTITDLFNKYPTAGEGNSYWVRVTVTPPVLEQKKKAAVLTIVDNDDKSQH